MKLNQIDLNKVAVFCQVVESGNNYQRASEALNVSPSAISQTITGLEGALGFLLFDRIGKKLVPTKPGLRIHKEFREAQAGFNRALIELSEPQAQIKGLLRIGSYLEFAKSRLSPVISEFIRENPDTQIKMVFDSPTRLQAMIAQGQLDLCFSIFPALEAKAIHSETVCQEELVLIAKRNSLSENPSYAEIMKQPIIEYYFNHQPICRWLALHFQKRPKKVHARIYAATAEMVLSLVRAGSGIGVVPAYLVNDTEPLKQIQIIRPTRKKLDDYIWLLERRTGEIPPIQQAFRQKLLDRLEK